MSQNKTIRQRLSDSQPIRVAKKVVRQAQQLGDPKFLEKAGIDLGYHSHDFTHPRESKRKPSE